uniref:50S ribosomal protein L19, chloroplastic n=2 Tax=Pinguiococcus pyrenoidosus TaxID=172671 RepID=A0A7R9YF76_9STRA|mmetsp:Transcript_8170/g.30712  ORF Transcript_8170/g.30712 Transcript_8170/m.30712 type:complete len:122 (+) Transcript_8170:325-690(+)
MTTLANEMKKELRQRQGIELPDYRVGDKVRVSFLQAKSEEKPDDYVGVIIANPKKGVDESILVRGVVKGDCFEVRVPLWSPLLKAVEILEPRCIHKGKKAGRRVRRSKLYYLRNREPSTYM